MVTNLFNGNDYYTIDDDNDDNDDMKIKFWNIGKHRDLPCHFFSCIEILLSKMVIWDIPSRWHGTIFEPMIRSRERLKVNGDYYLEIFRYWVLANACSLTHGFSSPMLPVY